MALFKLYGYDGEADIRGAMRHVSFDEDGLHIHGVTLREANDLLGFLSSGEVIAQQPGGEDLHAMGVVFTGLGEGVEEVSVDQAPSPVRQRTPAASTSNAKQAEPDKYESHKPQASKVSPQKVPASKPVKSSLADDVMTVDAESQEAPVTSAVPAEKAEPKAVEKPPAQQPKSRKASVEETAGDEVAAAKSTSSGSNDKSLVTALSGAKSLRDVVTILQDSGLATGSAIADAAVGLQAELPILSRVGNLAERIKRTASALGIPA